MSSGSSPPTQRPIAIWAAPRGAARYFGGVHCILGAGKCAADARAGALPHVLGVHAAAEAMACAGARPVLCCGVSGQHWGHGGAEGMENPWMLGTTRVNSIKSH